MAYDPYWDNVELLLPLTTNFLDISKNPKTVAITGSPTIVANNANYGEGCCSVKAATDKLSMTGIGMPGMFTVEGNIKATVLNNGAALFDSRDSDISTVGFVAYLRSTGKVTFATGNPFVATEGSQYPANTFIHIAFTRDASNVIRGFLNGVQCLAITNSSNFSNTSWRLFRDVSGNISQNFCANYVRVTVGAARYTANFTPPIEAFPNRGALYKLQGTAKFSDGAVASKVWSCSRATGALLSSAIPAADGAFTLESPLSDPADVFITKPGYRPLSYGPIVPYGPY